jgi:hypothetical protein
VSTENLSGAHAAIITVNGRDHRVPPTFRLSLAVEERCGKVFDVAKEVISGDCEVTLLGDLLELMLPQLSRDEIDAYFDEVGLAGVRTSIAGVLTQMLRGWRALSAEAEASRALAGRDQASIAAGDEPRPLEPRKGPGRPRGARNKPKAEAAGSPGEISSAAPAVSASDPAISGNALPSNLPLSGPQQSQNPPLTNGHDPETIPENVLTCTPSTGLFPAIE